MAQKRKVISGLIRFFIGLILLFAGLLLPSYFAYLSPFLVENAFNDSLSNEEICSSYISAGELSTANFFANDEQRKEIFKIVEKKPSLIMSGSENIFLNDFCQSFTFSLDLQKYINDEKFIPISAPLSYSLNRKNAEDFLSHLATENVLNVLNSSNTAGMENFDPKNAGASGPLESVAIVNASFIKGAFLSSKEQRKLVDTCALAKSLNTQSLKELENYYLSTLLFANALDISSLSNFIKLAQNNFDKLAFYGSLNNNPRLIAYYLFFSENSNLLVNYLDNYSLENLFFAKNQASLLFILEQNKPIYNEEKIYSFCPDFASFTGHLREFLPAQKIANNIEIVLALKIILFILAGYFISRGFFNIAFKPVLNRPSWNAPLSLLRGFFQAISFTILVVLFTEWTYFFASAKPLSYQNISINFSNFNKTIESQSSMNNTSILVVILFFLIQLTVYIICLIKVSSIKKMQANSSLKIKLLENEDNLFDSGLYIGLSGTIISLVLITMNLFDTSLMAAYSSTLFGILFAALVKIGSVRPLKAKLFIQAEKE